MLTQTLRLIVDHPYRRGIVITLTFLIGLAAIWPAADEYFALKERCAQTVSTLAHTRGSVAQLDRFQGRVTVKLEELNHLQGQTVNHENATEFRDWVLEEVRATGCRMRRIRVGDTMTQKWREGGDPLNATVGKAETPYELKQLPFSLSFSGSLAQVKEMLARLHASGKMSHTKTFALRPEGPEAKEVVLDMDLMLFDLVRSEEKATQID